MIHTHPDSVACAAHAESRAASSPQNAATIERGIDDVDACESAATLAFVRMAVASAVFMGW